MIYAPLFSILFFSTANAANNWSKVCLSGVCEYDLPSTNNSRSSGTIKIWGSQDSISDITTAAGWEILGCSPDALSQEVRIVCKNDETINTGCAHLFSKSGAEGKIVRLPENCGKSPFARVSRSWVPADQSIPLSVGRRIVRRHGVQPQVKALHLDTNFGAVNTSQTGIVNFALQAANVPGVNGEINISQGSIATTRAHSRFVQRGFLSGVLGGILNSLSFSKSDSKAFPIDATTSAEIFNQNISCPPIIAVAKVNVDFDAHGMVAVGIAASGTVVPPKFEEFGITASLSADLDGSIKLNANINGSLDSGKIQIFEVGLPGLSFPDILTIGPSFQVDAEIKASLELEADLNIGVKYNIANASFLFPPNGNQNVGGSFNLGDTPLQLSLSESAKATGSIEAHLIPGLKIGISALGIDANIFVDLDASAKASLTVGVDNNVMVTHNVANGTLPLLLDVLASQNRAIKRREYKQPGHNRWNPPHKGYNHPSHNHWDPPHKGYKYPGHNHWNSPVSHSSVVVTSGTITSLTSTGSASSMSGIVASVTSSCNSSASSTIASATPTGSSLYSSSSDFTSTVSELASRTNGVYPSVYSYSTALENATSTSPQVSSSIVVSNPYISNVPSASTGVEPTGGSPHSSSSNVILIGLSASQSFSSTLENATSTQTQISASASLSSVAVSASRTATSTASVRGTSSTSSAVIPTPTKISGTNVTGSTSFGGCFDVTAGLAVTVGADASFFGLFDPSTTLSLYNHQFNLFQKCFGDSTNGRRSLPIDSLPMAPRRSIDKPYYIPKHARGLQKRDFSCLSSEQKGTGDLTSLVDDTVKADSV